MLILSTRVEQASGTKRAVSSTQGKNLFNPLLFKFFSIDVDEIDDQVPDLDGELPTKKAVEEVKGKSPPNDFGLAVQNVEPGKVQRKKSNMS